MNTKNNKNMLDKNETRNTHAQKEGNGHTASKETRGHAGKETNGYKNTDVCKKGSDRNTDSSCKKNNGRTMDSSCKEYKETKLSQTAGADRNGEGSMNRDKKASKANDSCAQDKTCKESGMEKGKSASNASEQKKW